MSSASPFAIDHLVIVGNGMASHRLIQALVEAPTRPARITVIGAEAQPAYNRILLSPLLAGEIDPEGLALQNEAWYADHGVTLYLDEQVQRLDRKQRRVITTKRTLTYDRLVLATGSRPALPPVPGSTLSGIEGFRTLEDVSRLAAIDPAKGPCIVIGGGLLGLEAAEGLRKRGVEVSVLQRGAHFLNRQLDATAAKLLADELSARGLKLRMNARVSRFESDGEEGRVAAVVLEDGQRLPCQRVIVAMGITPNAELGQAAGLATERAIVVDDTLTTSDPRIHALGECCQFDTHTYGLVEPIWRQVEVLADHLAGRGEARYHEAPTATRLKVSGITLYAFGPTEASEEHEILRYVDGGTGDYRRLLLRNGRIEGAVLYGDTRMGPWYFKLALERSDISDCRRGLLFGEADASALGDASVGSSALSASNSSTSNSSASTSPSSTPSTSIVEAA